MLICLGYFEVFQTLSSNISGNHGDDWTIWEMKISAHLMEKGLDACLDPTFETRLPTNESGPFDMTVEDEENQKEAVDMNKKAMCQFIQLALWGKCWLACHHRLQSKVYPLSEWERLGLFSRIIIGLYDNLHVRMLPVNTCGRGGSAF